MEILGRQFELTMTSGPEIEGMRLALDDVTVEPRETMADVVHLDTDGSFKLTIFQDNVPAEAVAWLEAEARVRLPRVGAS